MSASLTARLFEILEAQAPFLLHTPISLASSAVNTIAIRTAVDGRQYLRFVLSTTTPREVKSIVPCVLETAPLPDEPAATTVVTRPWIQMSFYFRTLFGDDAPEYVLYRCSPAAASPDAVLEAGTVLGAATSELEVAFVAEGANGRRYLDPAVVVRTLALFSNAFEVFTDSFLELLLIGIALDPVDSFGLARLVDLVQDPALPLHRRRILEDALRAEYEFRQHHNLTPTGTTDALYRLVLPPPGPRTARAHVVASYHEDVEADPDGFAHFYVDDMNLHFAAFRADRYEMDLIDLRGDGPDFRQLTVAADVYALIANGPLFDLNECNLQPTLERAFDYTLACTANATGISFKGLTKGLLVFRNQGTELGECPIPSDPGVWRYHFAQTVTGEYQLHRDPIPATNDYACAIEPVYGVFRDGLRIGDGHEIDQLGSDGTPRGEPDSVFKEDAPSVLGIRLPGTRGISTIGTSRRSGVDYVFVLMRPDSYTSQPVMTRWEDMVQFLRDIDVVDALATEGDDSVGLIIGPDRPILKPGCKKDGVVPLAIAFRKV
jgi:hypothetical protein